MTKEDHIIVQSALNILAAKTASNAQKIVDTLTGYLWDEEEAGNLKRDWVHRDGLEFKDCLYSTLHEESLDRAKKEPKEEVDDLSISEAIQEVLEERFGIQFYGDDSEQAHLAFDLCEVITSHKYKETTDE